MHYNEFSKEYSDSFILWDVYNQKRRKTSCDTISGVWWGGRRHVGHILPKEVVGIAIWWKLQILHYLLWIIPTWAILSGTFYYTLHVKKDTKNNFEKNAWRKNKSRQNAQGLTIFFLQLILLNDCWRNLAGIVRLVWLIHGHIISDQCDINRIWAWEQQWLSGLGSPLELDLFIPVFFGYTYLRIVSYSCRLVRYNLRKSASLHHNVNFPHSPHFSFHFFSFDAWNRAVWVYT